MNRTFEISGNDYPLPKVDMQTVYDVVDHFAILGYGTGAPLNPGPAFAVAQERNWEMTGVIGNRLSAAGLTSSECRRAAKASIAITHLLLLAQARIDRGLPRVGADLAPDPYFLPIVTEDAVTRLFAGTTAGNDSFRDLATQNEMIPYGLSVLGLPIGKGDQGSPATRAAEIAAILTHGLLREQAAIDRRA